VWRVKITAIVPGMKKMNTTGIATFNTDGRA
jgi:hypothetical protein